MSEISSVAVTPVEDAAVAPLCADVAAAALTMARRFHAGATLWVAAPEWPAHAHHVAVEFVHPVVVGAPALPSFVLGEADQVVRARVLCQAGDLLLVVARATDPVARDLMRRAPAWGLSTVWIGSGARPTPGAADHVLWVDVEDPSLPLAGDYVRIYHLLWELTHVCFEHPGLLEEPPPVASGTCITCADEGRTAEVQVPPAAPGGAAMVRAGLGTEPVDVTLVGDVVPGDLLLVHAGFALTRLDPGGGS
jgi:hypothetical protein